MLQGYLFKHTFKLVLGFEFTLLYLVGYRRVSNYRIANEAWQLCNSILPQIR